MNVQFAFLSFSSFKLAEPEITGVKALSCLGVVDVDRQLCSPKGLNSGAWSAGGFGDRQPGTLPTVEGTAQPPEISQRSDQEPVSVYLAVLWLSPSPLFQRLVTKPYSLFCLRKTRASGSHGHRNV